MFGKKMMGAKVMGANDPGGCQYCGIGGSDRYTNHGCSSRSDKVSFLGIDRTPRPEPWGVTTGTGSSFPNQSAAAISGAATATQGNNLANSGTPAVMDWVMTFSPKCPSKLKQIYIDPIIAPELEITALYLGYLGWVNSDNLLAARGGGNEFNDAPASMFASLDVTVPLFQLYERDIVATQQTPFLLVGRTKGTLAGLTLRGAIIVESV